MGKNGKNKVVSPSNLTTLLTILYLADILTIGCYCILTSSTLKIYL